MNNRRHIQRYANEAARVVQVLYDVLLLAQSCKILVQFLCTSFISFYFIANGRTAQDVELLHLLDQMFSIDAGKR